MPSSGIFIGSIEKEAVILERECVRVRQSVIQLVCYMKGKSMQDL